MPSPPRIRTQGTCTPWAAALDGKKKSRRAGLMPSAPRGAINRSQPPGAEPGHRWARPSGRRHRGCGAPHVFIPAFDRRRSSPTRLGNRPLDCGASSSEEEGFMSFGSENPVFAERVRVLWRIHVRFLSRLRAGGAPPGLRFRALRLRPDPRAAPAALQGLLDASRDGGDLGGARCDGLVAPESSRALRKGSEALHRQVVRLPWAPRLRTPILPRGMRSRGGASCRGCPNHADDPVGCSHPPWT